MSSAAPARVPEVPSRIANVREPRPTEYPLWSHPDWVERFPWLVQGTTGRGPDGLDLGLFGAVPCVTAHERWRALRRATGLPAAAHARQVHAARILWHDTLPPGLFIGDDADGHATCSAGVLLTISVADCVPIFIVDPGRRAVALLHGGWRGVAAGIVRAGIAELAARAGSEPRDLALHCGPAICGECYEVGPEVPAALGITAGAGKVRLDVRAEIAARALRAGLAPDQVSVSTHCTRCDAGDFWSHRGGCRERQLGVLGIRTP